MEKEKKRYYWVEIPMETATAITSACETLASLMVGKLDIMEDIVSIAIKRRTGEEPNELTMDQVRTALKTLQYIGWDSTYGNKVNIHNFCETSDTLCDVMEVLNHQMGVDKFEGYEDCKYPMHWNDNMPLIRIIKIMDSVYNRNKQLPIFPYEKM